MLKVIGNGGNLKICPAKNFVVSPTLDLAADGVQTDRHLTPLWLATHRINKVLVCFHGWNLRDLHLSLADCKINPFVR